MELWLTAAISALITGVATPFVRSWLIGKEILDRPTSRSSHQAPVPRGGGLACILGLGAGAIAALGSGQQVPWAVLVGALGMAVVGFVDDRHQLPIAPRLISQVLIGATLGAFVGGPVWAIIGAILFPAVVNVVNFMDGINGITALTLALWGATAALAPTTATIQALSVLGAITAGCALGFLPWNAPRAKIFLGDVGSYLFGALAAGGIMIGTSAAASPLILIAPLSVYFADVSRTLVRRKRKGAPLGAPHREHIYQQIVVLGVPHTTAAAVAGLAAALVTLGWLVTTRPLGFLLSALLIIGYLSIPSLIVKRRERRASHN